MLVSLSDAGVRRGEVKCTDKMIDDEAGSISYFAQENESRSASSQLLEAASSRGTGRKRKVGLFLS
jgi:hypothetical protein